MIQALFDSGSQGIQEDGTDIVTHFPPDADLPGILSALEERDPGCAVTVTDAPTVDPGAWQGTVCVQTIGRILIAPPWLAHNLDPAATVIIEPAMAFGTGEHETTRGVVRLMQTLALEGATVADLGAGSAVLSIAAVKLGAARAVAIEIDPEAIGNAEENIGANGLFGAVTVIEGDATVILPLVAPVDLTLANIISSVLVALMPLIAKSLTGGGHAILSGILANERTTLLDAIRGAGLEAIAEDAEGEWWSVLTARR